MEREDFVALLRMCLTFDTIYIDGMPHHHRNGLAMGNNAAPPLAIIFMHHLEKQILAQNPNIKMWKRYIDDIFMIFDDMTSELLQRANSVNPAIRFTLETSANGCLPFLDLFVEYNGNRFETELFVKPVHSGHILPWRSHHPRKTKENMAFGEFLRAKKMSSSVLRVQRSFTKIANKLMNNGYPKYLITKMQKRAVNHTPKSHEDQPRRKKPYIILPYTGESAKRKYLSALKRSGLQDELRIVFRTRTLSSLLADKRKPTLCPPSCNTCQASVSPLQCFTKNVVYSIKCRHCSAEYIGETGRTIRTRIAEHCSRSSSAVFQHLTNHGDVTTAAIEWTIVHRDLSNVTLRRRVESLEIRSRQPYINSLLPQ